MENCLCISINYYLKEVIRMEEFSTEEFKKLIETVENFEWETTWDIYYRDRDLMVFKLPYYLGLRKGEVAHSRSCFVDRNTKTFVLPSHITKNHKNRLIPIPDVFFDDLIGYIDKYGLDFLMASRQTVDRKGKPYLHLCPRAVGYCFEKYMRLAGMKSIRDISKDGKLLQRRTMHSLRFTYANSLLDSGANLKVIQENLGHAWLSTTGRYLRTTLTQRREAVNKAFC